MADLKNMSSEEVINYLEKMLEELLKKRPELKKLQAQIDEIKKKAGDDPEERVKAMNDFFAKYIKEEFLPEINKINHINQEIKNQIKDMQEGKKSDPKKTLH